MLRLIFLLVCYNSLAHLTFAASPDTLILLDRPDFYEINHIKGDTIINSYFVGNNGVLKITAKDYSSAVLYKVIYSIGEHTYMTKEYHNKGSGNWVYYEFNSQGKIKVFGNLIETDSAYVVYDTLTGSHPEPPYLVWDYSYIYHQTIRVGNWLFFDNQNEQSPRQIFYRRD